jgi:hypothetical protein
MAHSVEGERMKRAPFSVSFCFTALALASMSGAQAQDALFLAGVQASSASTYVYAGEITPLQGATLGQGWYRKYIFSWLNYHYRTTQNNAEVEIRTNAPGFEAGFGHAWKGTRLNLDLSATTGYRHQHMQPLTPDGERSGGILTLNPQVQAQLTLTPTLYADLIANRAIGLGSSFMRERLGWKPAANWRTGIEAIQLDGRTYRLEQEGLFAALSLSNNISLEWSAGRARSQDGSGSAYASFGWARMF